MATHYSVLAGIIPWTEDPGGLESMGLQSQTRLNDWACIHTSYSFVCLFVCLFFDSLPQLQWISSLVHELWQFLFAFFSYLMLLFHEEDRVLVDYSGFPTVMAASLPQFCIISEQSLLWEPVGFIEIKPIQNLTEVQNHSIFAESRSFSLFH